MKYFKRNQRRRHEPKGFGGSPRRLRIEPLEKRLVLAALDLSILREAGVTIFGAEANDESGLSVSNVGDINGDDFDDVLIGARKGDASGNLKTSAGDSYVVFGKGDWSTTLTIDLANLGSAGVTIFGADAYDYSGRSVSGAGDLNGDGFDDLLIGAVSGDAASNSKANAGESYIVFGKANWSTTPTLNLATLGSAGVILYGTDVLDYSGRSVSGAGDVNGDGFDDLLIGAHYGDANLNAKVGAGETAVIFGKATWSSTVDLASLGTAGVTFFGADGADASGFAVSNAGDVNGDGFDDMLIGARYGDAANNAKNGAGDSYVVFGKADWSGTLAVDLASLGSAGITIFGADAFDYSGVSVSGAGDVNGDGFDDVLIGAPGADTANNAKSNPGESYLLFGKAVWGAAPIVDLATLGAAGVTFYGADDYDLSGVEVSGAGDINGDGFDDLIIGARYADAAGNAKNAAGETYVVFGRADWSNLQTFFLANLANGGITIRGAEVNDYSGLSVSNAGDVNGDGFDDLFVGAVGGDAAANAKETAGDSYIVFGSNSFTGSATHLGTAAGETITGNPGDDVIIAGRGNDVLVGMGGADVLRGGQGHDVLAIGNLNFRRVVGGRGTDLLRLDTSGVTLDLTTLADNRILSIEQINLTGTGANTLTLNAREVLNLSDESNTLVVSRDGNDIVNRGTGWTQQANELINGALFEVFTQGAATLKVQAVFADISVTKTASLDIVTAGTSFTYTIQIDNDGPAGASGVRLSDTLAAGLTFDPINSSGGCVANGQIVTCNVGTIVAGSSVARQIVVKLASSATDEAVINNTVNVTANESDPTPNDRTASDSITVSREADLEVTKSATSSNVSAGASFGYTFVVENQGPSDGSDVTLTDTLAAELSFNAASSSPGCSATGQVVTCTVGTMVTGANATRQIGVRVGPTVTEGTVINNAVTVSANETDPDPDDNIGEVDVTVSRQADLKITKTAPANPVLAGGSFSYGLQITNFGPSDATGVTVTDTLPAGLTFDSANSSLLCSAVGQLVTCNIGQLGPTAGDSLTLTVLVDASLAEGELISNTANIAGNETDPDPSNNSSTVSVTVTHDTNPFPWQNSRDPLDVNNDRFVAPIDVLQIINELNLRRFSASNGALPIPPPPGPYPYLDVTGDNFAAPLDALTIINFLNADGEGESRGEGESSFAGDGKIGDEEFATGRSSLLSAPLIARSLESSDRGSVRRSDAASRQVAPVAESRRLAPWPHTERSAETRLDLDRAFGSYDADAISESLAADLEDALDNFASSVADAWNA